MAKRGKLTKAEKKAARARKQAAPAGAPAETTAQEAPDPTAAGAGITGDGALGARRAVFAGLVAMVGASLAAGVFQIFNGVILGVTGGGAGAVLGGLVLEVALLLLLAVPGAFALGIPARVLGRAGVDPRRPWQLLREAYADPDADRIAFVATWLAWLAVVLLWLLLSFRMSRWIITTFHAPTLMAALQVALVACLAAAAAVLGITLQRGLTVLLRWWEGRAGGPPLSKARSLGVPAAVLLPLLGIAGGVASEIFDNLELLRAIDFAPLVAAGCWVGGAVAGLWLGARIVARAPGEVPGNGSLAFALVSPTVVACIALVALEGSATVRAAWSASSDLGVRVAGVVQALTDGDGDGYSDFLGGGDCDDNDPRVHPGGLDVPGNGLDENCNGADAGSGGPLAGAGFVPLPIELRELDVLLVTVDALRADHVGAYGYTRPTTPRMDALAARGTRFSRAYAGAPSTRYNLPILMTSRPLSVLKYEGLRPWPPTLSADHETLAEVLTAAGITTLAATNLGYPRSHWGLEQGFNHYDNTAVRKNAGGQDGGGVSADYVADRAIAMLKKLPTPRSERTFTWVHFYDPHHRYVVPPGVPSFGPTDLDRYDAEISFVDHHLGRILDYLKASGGDAHTAVIITSDHGEAFGEHGKTHHGYDLYDVFLRVPLIVALPPVAADRLGGRVVDTAVGTLDVAPTVLNLMGLPPAKEMLGRSLAGAVLGSEPLEPAPVVSEVFYSDGLPEEMRKRALTWGSTRLLHTVNHDVYELYDLSTDPGETNDLAHGNPELLAEMRGRLAAWMDAVTAPDELAAIAAAMRSEPPVPALPSDAVFGGGVKLLGADLDPPAPRPGQSVRLTLYFQVERPLDDAYRVFVHVSEAGGTGPVLASGDHEPIGGAFPTNVWRPGDILADTHSFRMPAVARVAGKPIALFMGLYRGPARVPVVGSTTLPDRRVKIADLP